jgi:adenine-specific DNA-methyltransferase
MSSNIELSNLSIKQLIELCKKEKITKYSNKKKEELIKLINNKNVTTITTVTTSLYIEEKNKNIDNSTYDELKNFYNEVLNTDKSTYKSSNDEPTPIDCIEEMISKVPEELWKRNGLKILDPCCGNGNFSLPIMRKLMEQINEQNNKKYILENILYFNDINDDRINNVENIYCKSKYNLNITKKNFIDESIDNKYDLIVANPPYAKLLENGKRASKNHNLIKDFIEKSLELLKPDGYLLFITPDNWMSYSDKNTLISRLTELQIIHLDIHSAKKYFKKIGSSFTWYIIQNKKSYQDINVSGIWKNISYNSSVKSMVRKYIPLYYNNIILNILTKTVDNDELKKFKIETNCNLHRFTKKDEISDNQDDVFKYKLIHTPKQTVWASRPHIYQDGYKVFISTTDKYSTFIDNCGMTQSIVFIRCASLEEATKYKQILDHPLYLFINNICRYGNFNNIRILQSFPIPELDVINEDKLYKYFKITDEEKEFIIKNL